MGHARDEAGNIWETDASGNPVRLAQPASGGSVVHLPRSPQQNADDARKAATSQREAAAAARAAAEFRMRSAEWGAEHNPDGTKKEASVAPGGDPTKTGADYLKTLPANDSAQVRALAEGRMAFPAGKAATSPYWQQKIAQVSQFDPEFDAINFNSRAATRRDFTAGASSKNIKALNTALGHLGQLYDQIGGTASHGGFPGATLLNGAQNAINRSSGSSGPTLYAQTAGALAGELTQVYRQSGGAEADIQRYLSELDPNASEEQKKAAISNMATLLNSRLDAINDQYVKGMGTTAQPLQVLDPHAVEVLHKVLPGFNGGGAVGGTPGGGSGGGSGGDGGNPLVPASGATRTVNDPQTSDMINAMVHAGATPEQIRDAVTARGQKPLDPAAYAAAVKWQQENPGKAYNGARSSKVEDMSLMQRAAGSGTGAFLANMANDFTAGSVGALTGDRGKGALDAMSAMYPNASAAGGIIGGITGAATGEGLLAARAPAALAAYVPRAADALYGGLSGFNNADPGDGARGAVLGAALGAGGGYLGSKAVAGVGSATRGMQSTALDYLRSRGIPLTAGQVLGQGNVAGRFVKKMEDAATSLPGVGNMIDARRRDGFEAFNRAAYNDGAAPVGAAINAAGPDALASLQGIKSQAYRSALDPVTINANDPQFLLDRAATRNAATAIPNVGGAQDAATSALDARFGGAIDPATGLMSGNGFQEAYRGLARTGRERANGDYGHEIGQVMRQGQDTLSSTLEAQNPGAFQGFMDANAVNRRLRILADAQGAAKNQEGNLFSPAQLNTADANNATRLTGKVASATGDRPFADLANYGQQVMGNRVPDSGTATRLAAQRALAALTLTGGGGGIGYMTGGSEGAGDGAGLGLMALAALSAGGTNRVQSAAVKALMDRPDAAIRIGDVIRRNRAIGGYIGAGILPMLTPGN